MTLSFNQGGTCVLGGSFTALQPYLGTTVVTRNFIARVNTDGSVDGPFNPNPNSSVNLVYVLSNQQILISGGFNYVTPNGSVTAFQISELALINADGSIDTAFNPAPNGSVFAVSVQSDGKIILGGGFTMINGVTRSYIARLNADGTLDTTTTFDAKDFRTLSPPVPKVLRFTQIIITLG